ncbi:putative bifunctional diguanylate cyclase/phosphodiesterase [Ureibacillus sp. FSL K6-2830]|uniref:putative bifunctional diguanylate cyclase/phosphodiesterase n=1 Tax=Ureibacillus sp. FSL K6-2830 TaxID=2954610 RepID=UPI0030F61C5A
MINFPANTEKDYLQYVMKLNPFNAIVILKQLRAGKFSVEMINSSAYKLTPNTFEKGMDAEQFFELLNWNEIKKVILEKQEKIQYITMNMDEELQIYVEPIKFHDELYYAVIMSQGKEFSYISFIDENTGLLNRRALNFRWDEKYRYYNHDMNLSILLVDLDRFKKYNESLGKQNADIMIKQISERFKRLKGKNIELYHYNGDEFLYLMRHYLREEVELLANQVLDELKVPFIIDGQEYFVTASIGIATLNSEQKRDFNSLLHQAEQALFYVKTHGRAHYRFYREEMSKDFKNEVLMEAHLKRAIEFNELSIHLQPQVNYLTNEIDSFEALLRWNNPKFGYVPPSQFIPLAESSGLIIEIGDWVLEQVCSYQREWRKKGYRPVRIAVNISPIQFKQLNFPNKIESVLKKYEVDPQFIELEITESSMENVEETEEILKKLKKLGVYVSVDDFGTGYSSLSYLKKYPIDIIKIDQSFISDINKDEKNEAIIKAIISLSHHLGMDVVAEGVEEKYQELFLKENRCKKGQGYLYNKPMTVGEVIKKYLECK